MTFLTKISFLDQNAFVGNSAPYGNDYSSYPSRIVSDLYWKKIKSEQIYSISGYPGVTINNFILTIIDHYGQKINTENGM